MVEQIQKISIKGLICNNGKIFIVRDHWDNWELPGGRVEYGENHKEALQREFKEELGVKEIKIGNIVNVFDFVGSKKSNDIHFVVVIYECFANLNKLKLSGEHAEFKWIRFDEVYNYPMKNGYLETIEKFKKLKNL